MKQTTPKKTQESNHRFKDLNSLKDSYRYYKSDYPNSHLEWKDYNNICKEFFKEVLFMLIEGMEVQLPYLGLLKVVKRKRDFNNLQPNWKKTKELWEKDSIAKEEKTIVYHLNEHSGGHYYRFHWTKGRVKNLSAYSFIPVRSAKKQLAAAVISDNKDYI